MGAPPSGCEPPPRTATREGSSRDSSRPCGPRFPGVAEEYSERLGAAIDPIDAEDVARNLVEDLERLLVEPLVIAIDDAERLDDAPALAIIDALLDGADQVLRIGLCSRRALGLRLARLKATGRFSELGPADLAFSPAECAACLRLVRGQEPSSDEVDGLFAATEGWPLGVALAAAAGPDAEPVAGRGREAIFEYLAEEVFESLEPDLQRRLVDASVVDELDAEVVSALELGGSFRAEIEGAGVFVRPLGDAYALHPLFRDFLRARLRDERDPTDLSELQRQVAAARAESGRGAEAIEHWLAAGDHYAAADAIAAHGIGLVGTSPETVADWLERLPDELCDVPILRLLRGRIAMGAGDFGAAVENCRAGLDGLESAGAPDGLLWAARLALTDAHIAALDLEAAAEVSAGAEDAGPEAGPAAAFCSLVHPAILVRLGRPGSDRSLALALDRPLAKEMLGPELAAFRAQYRDLPAGRLDAALTHIDEGIAALEYGDMTNRLPYLLAFKMAIHEARGELEEALGTFDTLLSVAQRTGLAGYIGAGARLAGATILALLDRREEAIVQLERVDRDFSSWVGCDKHAAGAVLAARDGDRSSALAEALRAVDEAQRMPAFDRVRPTSVLAPVLCDTGRPDAARAALEGVLEALGPHESKARTRTAMACVLHREGDRDAAYGSLSAAFEEAGDGARFLLRNEWPQVEDVLWSALEAGSLDPLTAVEALDAAFPGGPQVVALVDHPRAEVRAAALAAAAAAGRPEAIDRIAADEPSDDVPGIDQVRARFVRRPPTLEFRTLGRFEIRRGAYAVEAARWERKVAARVVRFLLIRGGRLVPEDELLEALWPDKVPDSARRGLQTAISSARSVLDLPWETSRLRVQERAYALALRDGDRLDADAFATAAQRALGGTGPERIAAMEAAVRLWTGEPLPEERYSDWAASWREQLNSLHAEVLGALAEEHGRAGDHNAAARAARALVDLDPLDERAQRLLMGAYASAGRRGAGLRQFLECRRALVEQLGIEPEAETLALQRRILAGA